MKHLYFLEEYSRINSVIHRLEPRVKIVAFISFLLFITFTPMTGYLIFVSYGVLLFILILLSRIPLGFILKRSLVVIPFVLLISLFLPFIKKGQSFGGFSFGTLRLNLSYDGLTIFWGVLIKAYLSILCIILLSASSRFSELLKGFERLKSPKLIVMIISFMYRYIFVFYDELMKMKQAKDCRSVGNHRWLEIKALSNMVGVLFIRAYERAEFIYMAMCSRGFDGTIRTMDEFRLRGKDLIFLFIIILYLGVVRFLFC